MCEICATWEETCTRKRKWWNGKLVQILSNSGEKFDNAIHIPYLESSHFTLEKVHSLIAWMRCDASCSSPIVCKEVWECWPPVQSVISPDCWPHSDTRHEKIDLKVFVVGVARATAILLLVWHRIWVFWLHRSYSLKVGVIPKEGWLRPRAPIVLLVWQRQRP